MGRHACGLRGEHGDLPQGDEHKGEDPDENFTAERESERERERERERENSSCKKGCRKKSTDETKSPHRPQRWNFSIKKQKIFLSGKPMLRVLYMHRTHRSGLESLDWRISCSTRGRRREGMIRPQKGTKSSTEEKGRTTKGRVNMINRENAKWIARARAYAEDKLQIDGARRKKTPCCHASRPTRAAGRRAGEAEQELDSSCHVLMFPRLSRGESLAITRSSGPPLPSLPRIFPDATTLWTTS